MADITKFSGYLKSRTQRTNPDTGDTWTLTYEAILSKLLEIKAYWDTLNSVEGTPLGYGYKTALHESASGKYLTVEVPEEILFTTRWNLDTELVTVPIWWNDDVRN